MENYCRFEKRLYYWGRNQINLKSNHFINDIKAYQNFMPENWEAASAIWRLIT